MDLFDTKVNVAEETLQPFRNNSYLSTPYAEFALDALFFDAADKGVKAEIYDKAFLSVSGMQTR